MLSRCFLDGVGAFVTGLSQISSFFSFMIQPLRLIWVFSWIDVYQQANIVEKIVAYSGIEQEAFG